MTKNERLLLDRARAMFCPRDWSVICMEHAGGYNLSVTLRGRIGRHDGRLSFLISRRSVKATLEAAEVVRRAAMIPYGGVRS
jgi:hypothetical protein